MKKPRTINALYEELIAEDPNCAITKTALRRLVTTGAIPSTRVGTKYLVCKEDLDAYFSGGAE